MEDFPERCGGCASEPRNISARHGRASRPQHPQGTKTLSALLSATPFTAAASCTAAWNQIVAPESPAGHAVQPAAAKPWAFVDSSADVVTGTGTSVPPLNGAGVLEADT